MTCPICGAERPAEPHLDWCDYDGHEPEDDAERGSTDIAGLDCQCQACGVKLTMRSALHHEHHHHDGAQTCWPITDTAPSDDAFHREYVDALVRRTGERGSTDIVGLVAGALAAFLTAVLLLLVAGSTTPVTHARTVSTAVSAPATAVEAPTTTTAQTPPSVVVEAPSSGGGTDAPRVTPRTGPSPVATSAPAGTPQDAATGQLGPATTITADPAIQLVCEVYSAASVGPDTPHPAGWWPATVDAATAAHNPGKVRNCTPARIG